MKRWVVAATIVLVATIGVLVVSPSWIGHACDNVTSDCGVIPPFLFGFAGVAVALVVVFVGALRGIDDR
jgi:hypothetical protein